VKQTCSDNQWARDAWYAHLDDAKHLQILDAELYETLKQAYIHAWLDCAVPAGNA
jgi:hypothetical protein